MSPKRARVAIASVAHEMVKFSSRVVEEVPLLHAGFDANMDALSKLVIASAELYPEQMEETKRAAASLLEALATVRQTTTGFLDSTAALPPMTKELNLAKRRQAAALRALIAEFEYGERLLLEGLAVIDPTLRRRRSEDE